MCWYNNKMEENKMNAEQIKQLRLRLGLTQEQFAHLVGMAFATINKWERGKTKPSPLAEKALKRLYASKNAR